MNRILNFSEGEPSAVVRDVDFSVTLPFHDHTAKVSVYDRNKTFLLETDLGSAKAAFCAVHAADERCRGSAAVPLIGLLVVFAVIGAGAYHVLNRKKGGGK